MLQCNNVIIPVTADHKTSTKKIIPHNYNTCIIIILWILQDRSNQFCRIRNFYFDSSKSFLGRIYEESNVFFLTLNECLYFVGR